MTTFRLPLLGAILAAVLILGCDDPVAPVPEPAPDSWIPKTTTAPSPLPIAITEICPGNARLQDQFGEDPGWVEITNRSDREVRTQDYLLAGDESKGKGWKLPDSLLAPGGSILVFLSGRDLRNTEPARRDANLNPQGVSSWSDSLLPENAGLSAVRPLSFPNSLSGRTSDGATGISARLVLRDNRKRGTGYSSANVSVEFLPWDASNYDHLLIRGTFPTNQELQIRLCNGPDCWQRGSVILTGNGQKNGEYLIRLGEFDVNLGRVTGLQIDPPQDQIGSYDFDIVRVGFRSIPRHAHADFKIKRRGGWLALVDSSGATGDRVEYPDIPATASWAVDTATGTWNIVSAPTPNAKNPAAPSLAILETPSFLTAPGFLPGPTTIRLAPAKHGKVRCAAGGSRPTSSSPTPDTGIRIDSSTVVSCAVFTDDGRHGASTTATYLVKEDAHLPVVSVSVDPTSMFDPESGLYSMGPNASDSNPNFGANFWRNTELPAHVELFEDGKRGFGMPAGVGIFGNWTRANRKKAFSVQFREEYGANELQWPLFPHHPQVRTFKGFALRANGSNSGTDYVRDGLMQSFTEARGLEFQLSRHVALYINGRYWGIYEIREKMDSDYFKTRFGIDKSDVDLIKNNNILQAGSLTGWNQIRATAENARPDDSAEWAYIAQQIDLDNYMDYLAAELYSNNQDWPANNSRCWRHNGANPSPWRMMMFDLDGGLGGFSGPATENPFPHISDSLLPWDAYPNGRGSNVFARRIFQRIPLRNRFLNRFLVQLATNLSWTATSKTYDSVKTSIAGEVPRDILRWDLDPSRIAEGDRTILDFLEHRPGYLRRHMRSFFQLDSLSPVDVSVEGGTLLVEGIPVGRSYIERHFVNVPVRIQAITTRSGKFLGWSDGVTTPERMVHPGATTTPLVAKFE